MFLQAEEITLTIGQAFELAYKKFLESKGKDLEKEKQSMVMHKRIELLENENKELKKRLTDIANIKGDNDVKQYMRENNVSAFTAVIRWLRPEFKFPAKMEIAFSQMLAIGHDLTNSNSF